MLGLAAEEKFWDRVSKQGSCWVWTGEINGWGYGATHVERKHRSAHRVAYEMARGPIPPGMQVDHLCGNKVCVNPDHLEPVTLQENLRRARVAGRIFDLGVFHKAKTQCPHGHAYVPGNLYLPPRGGRICLTCKRKHLIAWKLSRKRRGVGL